MASTGIISDDTNGLRTSEVRHTVDDADANGDLGRLRLDVTRPETVAGEGLEPMHRILGKRLPMVTTVLLPFSTTVTGNCINRAIATPHRAYPLANEGTLAWQNRRNSTACSNARMAWLGVVGTADDIDLFFARGIWSSNLARASPSGTF
ncbi:MAG: hypothetical protein E5299_00376 [Burkholderia gladioli]|nr:MAG: hypothetical protein E5299_00376 [Burkholderia gladioli]